jgi:hypothetical protein
MQNSAQSVPSFDFRFQGLDSVTAPGRQPDRTFPHGLDSSHGCTDFLRRVAEKVVLSDISLMVPPAMFIR